MNCRGGVDEAEVAGGAQVIDASQDRERGIREQLEKGLSGPAKSLITDDDEHGARDFRQLLQVRGGSGRRRTAARAAGSLPGVWAKREKA